MKLAVIPPLSLLPWALASDYHLMLPQLLYSRSYEFFFRHLCLNNDQYVILDNGAAEGYEATDEELVRLVAQFQPDELVLPDVIGDGPATVKRVGEFLRGFDFEPNCKIGAVAAGQDRADALCTAVELLSKYPDTIDVLYIPRSLVTPDDPKARLHLAEQIHDISDREIHFLGASRFWVGEIREVAALPFVRGMDTSAPFNYTFYGQWVGRQRQITRPGAYFTIGGHNFDQDLLTVNITTMKEWADGVD